MDQFRQGDVFGKKVKEVPENVKPVKKDRGAVVLAYGEVTGHMHAIYEDEAELYEGENGVMYLRLGKDSVLRHGNYGGDSKTADHDPIALGAGVYEVRRQREHDWFTEETRYVAD